MNLRTFLRGMLAALELQGCTYLDMRSSASELRVCRALAAAGQKFANHGLLDGDDLIPSPITEHYDGIINGLLGVWSDFPNDVQIVLYGGVLQLTQGPERAAAFLERTGERARFEHLAGQFAHEMTSP